MWNKLFTTHEGRSSLSLSWPGGMLGTKLVERGFVLRGGGDGSEGLSTSIRIVDGACACGSPAKLDSDGL